MAIRFSVWPYSNVTRPKEEMYSAHIVEQYRQPGTPFRALYVRYQGNFWYYTDDPREPLAVQVLPLDKVEIRE